MDTVVVVLLAVLVAGLLRSHADILRALHSLGAGVGDPTSPPERDADTWADNSSTPVSLHLGPPLPSGRNTRSAHDIEGVDPHGDAVVVSVSHSDHLTLLAFLSSGCTTCAGFWTALADPSGQDMPGDVRIAVVTKGPELELPTEVRRRTPPGTTVVMSSQAWDDYEVPGSPFFVLVDGRRHERVGEGVARHFAQVADLVRRARAEAQPPVHRSGPLVGLGGRAREELNDGELIAAGIPPGHASLYPRSLNEVFSGAPERADGPAPAS